MRIVIVQSGLSAGGAEKIVNLLALHRAALGDEVHVLVFSGARESSYFKYTDDVQICSMNDNSHASGNPLLRVARRVKWLRRQFRTIRPDLVVSFLTKTNVMNLLASLGTGIPVIISERNNPYRQEASMFWRVGLRLLQPFATLLVMQTQAARMQLGKQMQARAVVIPNPNTLPVTIDRNRRFTGSVVATGRLTPQKGFDLLLQAFAIVDPQLSFASLTIFGEGPERSRLLAQAKDLGISHRVNFPGTTAKPGEWLKAADVFVLSSRYEGFPNVLVEAMAAGLPSIAFSCPWGPEDIITHEKNGLLLEAENVNALAAAMVRLLQDERLRKELSEASEEIASRFELKKIMGQWDEAIDLPFRSAANVSTMA
jgi:glycosyltransferase involved in cell wall biosynthesis